MLQDWLRAAYYLDLCCIWTLIATLGQNGLFRAYRFLFAYLLVDGCASTAGLFLHNGTQLYFLVYIFGQTIKIVLAVFVVLELYQLALAGHPALARFGRGVVAYVLGAAALVAVGALAFDATIPAGRSPVLQRLNEFERTMDLSMLVFLLAIAVFMAWFPVRLTRNSVLYIAGFVVYFSSRALGLLITNLIPRLAHPMDVIMLGVAIACLVVWTVALRRKGEETTIVTGHRWDPDAMDRLHGQLTTINTRLLRLSRR